ncbi:MAG: TfoX/Sxy family protein [Gammaproteobacteria bacterium]|nr:TfoX/Sxy family protein [Gammaproteobacteria bacterium]
MSEFIDFLSEVFIDFGELRSKRMFGGHGIYHQDLMIGLVANNELYLKVDALTEDKFRAVESSPFQYNKNGKIVTMSYYQAPQEIFDEPRLAASWAQLAFEAAFRNAAKV